MRYSQIPACIDAGRAVGNAWVARVVPLSAAEASHSGIHATIESRFREITGEFCRCVCGSRVMKRNDLCPPCSLVSHKEKGLAFSGGKWRKKNRATKRCSESGFSQGISWEHAPRSALVEKG